MRLTRLRHYDHPGTVGLPVEWDLMESGRNQIPLSCELSIRKKSKPTASGWGTPGIRKVVALDYKLIFRKTKDFWIGY